MLPPEEPKTKMVNTGMTVAAPILERLDAIVEEARVKSRNKLIGSFLAFAVELYPLLRPLEKRLATAQVAEGKTRAELLAHLVELGLGVYEQRRKLGR